MPAIQQHIIGKCRLEVNVKSQAEGDFLFEVVSHLSKQKLPAIIDKVLREHGKEDLLLRLDKVVLQLGKIQASDFESQFLLKLEQELSFLFKNLNQDSQLDTALKKQQIPTAKTKFDSIVFFLKKGYLPWWESERTATSIDELLQEVLADKQASMVSKESWRMVLSTESVLARVENQLSGDSIKWLNQRLFSDKYQKVCKIVSIFLSIQRAYPFTSTEKLERAIQMGVFRLLISPQIRFHFGSQNFYLALLSYISTAIAIDLKLLISHIKQASKQLSPKPDQALSAILRNDQKSLSSAKKWIDLADLMKDLKKNQPGLKYKSLPIALKQNTISSAIRNQFYEQLRVDTFFQHFFQLPSYFIKQVLMTLVGGKIERLARQLQRSIGTNKKNKVLHIEERALYRFLLEEMLKRKAKLPSFRSALRNFEKKYGEEIHDRNGRYALEDTTATPIPRSSLIECFRFYLEKGYLLLNTDFDDLHSMEQQIADLAEENDEVLRSLLWDILENPIARERLWRQLSPASVYAIVVLLAADEKEKLLSAMAGLTSFVYTVISSQQSIQQVILQRLIQALAEKKEHFLVKEWLPVILVELAKTLQIEIDELKSRFLLAIHTLPSTAKARKLLWPHLGLNRTKPKTGNKKQYATLLSYLKEEGKTEKTDTLKKDEVIRLLQSLIAESEPVVEKELGRLFEKENLRAAWLQNLDTEVLRLLAQLKSGDQWPSICSLLTDLSILHWEEADKKQIEKMGIQLLLELLVTKGFELSLFWLKWQDHFANFRSQSKERIAQIYHQQAKDLTLLEMLESPLKEILEIPPSATIEAAKHDLSTKETSLIYFLQHGRFSSPTTRLSRQEMAQVLNTLIKEKEAFLLDFWVSVSPTTNIAVRLNTYFDTNVQINILSGMYKKEVIKPLLGDLERIYLSFKGQKDVKQLLGLLLSWAFDHLQQALDIPRLLKFLLEQIALDKRITYTILKANLRDLDASDYSKEMLEAISIVSGTLSQEEEEELETWVLSNMAKHKVATSITQEKNEAFDPLWIRTQLDRLELRLLPEQARKDAVWWDDESETTLEILLPFAKYKPEALYQLLIANWAKHHEALSASWPKSIAIRLLKHRLGPLSFFVEGSLAIVGEALPNWIETKKTKLLWAMVFWNIKEKGDFSTTAYMEAYLNEIRHLSRQTIPLFLPALQEVAAKKNATEGINYSRLYELLRDWESPKDKAPKKGLISKDTTNIEGKKVSTPPSYPMRLKDDIAGIAYYLGYGSLPPQYRHWSREYIVQRLLFLFKKHTRLAITLLQEIAGQEKPVKRLLLLLPSKDRPRIISLVYPEVTTDIVFFWEELLFFVKEYKLPLTKEALDWFQYQHLLQYAFRKSKVAFLLLNYAQDLVVFIALKNKPTLQQWREKLKMIQQQEAQRFIYLRQLIPAIQDRLLGNEVINKNKDNLETVDTAGETLEEAVFVSNAGLILLSPFLPRYFETLGMLRNKAFKDVEAATRAVHLLQYLATGQTETAEHLLVFNKILCALPIESPIPIAIEITQEEVDLSASLLNAVLQNWEIMKNSSIENLCGSFLLREGRLLEEKDRWDLHVEHKPFDLVLSSLPWTISMINLPWMQKRIDVEWRTTP